jgi:predicted nucleic-acid-binding Zn-ribbon protein
MKNGQCPKCGSRQVYSNTNRKFPALNTLTIGSANFGNRYAYLDTYICANCGYVENYVAKREDLNYIREEWVLVTQEREQVSDHSNEDSASLGFVPL